MTPRRNVRTLVAGMCVALLMTSLGVAWAGQPQEATGPAQMDFESVRLPVSADTTLHAWYPDANSAASATLGLRSQDAAAPLVKVDLSTLDEPSQMAVASAKLHLYVQSSSNTQPLSVVAYAVHRPWVASEATWRRAAAATLWGLGGCNATPDDRAAEGSPAAEITAGAQWLTLDVTQQVSDWLAGTLPNQGLLLKASARGSVAGTLFSSEHASVAYRPYLEIQYLRVIPVDPTPTVTPTPYEPRLALHKVGPTGPLAPDEQTLTYSITVSNVGTAPATGIVLTDVLPLGTIYAASSAGGVYDQEAHTITWQVIDLPMGESLTIEVDLGLAKWVRELGNIINVVRASCSGCPGVAEAYWKTIVVAPTPTPTATPSPTPPPRLWWPLVYQWKVQ